MNFMLWRDVNSVFNCQPIYNKDVIDQTDDNMKTINDLSQTTANQYWFNRK